MSAPRRTDLKRLAAQVRLAGERLEAAGLTLWDRSLGWKQGPRAAAYGQAPGTALEPCQDPTCTEPGEHQHPRPTGDPSGEEAVERLRGHPSEQGVHAELRVRLARVAVDVEWLNMALAPFVNLPRTGGLAGADVAAAGWCRSCFRDSGYLEPVHVNRAGERIYRDWCRWCGSFKAEQGQEPPLVLVQARHAGERITEAQVARALRRTG